MQPLRTFTTIHNHPEPLTTTNKHLQSSITTHNYPKNPKLVTNINFDYTTSIITDYVFDTDTDAAAKHKVAGLERCLLKRLILS